MVLTAAVSLTCGEPSGPDPTAVAVVLVTPDTSSIDTGDSLQLTAVARNAAGTELSGKVFTWSTLDGTLVTVSGVGRVRGLWPGEARVVATSEERADTARVRVKAKIDSIVLTPRLDTLRSFFEQRTLTATPYIGAQAYDGGEYTWQRSDTTFLSLSTGAPTSRTAQATARLANGTTIVRVRELRGASDSARIVVRQRPKTIVLAQQLRAYRACPVRLTVFVADSLNFPVADAHVTWRSTDTTLARIDSTGLMTPLAPGLDSIVVQAGPVSRSAALTISVAPTVTLQTTGVASAVTTVGRGQFALGHGSLGGAYSDAPARFSIVSSDTTVLAVPSDTSVIAGQPGFGPLRLVGRTNGTVTLTPYLCDVPGSPMGFTVTRPVLALSGDLVTAARIDDAPAMLAILTRDSTGALQYAADPVTVQIASTDTTVLHPDSIYRHLLADNFRAEFFFTFPDSGSARLIVRDSAGLYLPDSTAIVHVVYPPIYFSDYLNYVSGDTLRVGMRQRVYPPNQNPQVVLDRLVVGAPLSIRLSMSDTMIARLTPDSVTIPLGGSGAPIDIAGGDVRDTATLTASAIRHRDGHLVVVVDRPKVTIGTFNGQAFPGESIYVQVAAWDSATFTLGYPTEDVTFNLSASDTSVVSTDSTTTLTIRAGTAVSATVGLRAKGPGTTTITAIDPRAVAYAYAPGTTSPIAVVAPYLSIDSTISLGIRQKYASYVVENGPHQGAVSVHMQQRNPAVLSLSDTVFAIGAGENFSAFSGTGIASGVDTVIVTAAGFQPDTSIVTVGPGRIFLGNWPSLVAVGDSFPEWIYILAPNGSQSTTADTVVFTLAPNSNLEFRQDGAVITTVTIPAGQTYSSQTTFYVKAKAAGTGSVTITAPNYTPLTQSITVAP